MRAELTEAEAREAMELLGVGDTEDETGQPHVREWPTMDQAAFSGLPGDVVSVIGPQTESDPVAILLQFLNAFGNAIGRRAHYRVEADRHYSNIYTALIGETAKGRKGTSWGHVRGLFEGVDRDWISDRLVSGLSSGEGLVWQVRDPVTKREAVRESGRATGEYQEVVTDPGIDDKRLLVIEAELAGALRVLQREGSTLSAIIRDAWDRGHLCFVTKNNPAKATDAHISIIGHITRTELLRYLEATEAGNGFGNRFLWAMVRRARCLPFGGHIDQRARQDLIERLATAVLFGRNADEVAMSPEAREVWAAVYPELSEGKPGLLGAMIARSEAQAVRLAMLYALQDLSRDIHVRHLEAALAVWDYCEHSARYIFGDSLGDPTADAILEALRGSFNGLTRTEINTQVFKRHKSATEIGRALNTLVEMGRIGQSIEETGGRSVERWRVTGPRIKRIKRNKEVNGGLNSHISLNSQGGRL